jgi:hypothetical protein
MNEIYNIKLLLVIDTFEIKYERALHKILENLYINIKMILNHLKNVIYSVIL